MPYAKGACVAREFNLKSQMRLISWMEFEAEQLQWAPKGADAVYEPSNYHKRNPEAWNLPRPIPPRPYASKCEDLLLLQRYPSPTRELLEKIRILIANAFEKGTFSASIECGWPTCIWAVTEDGQIAEAHRGTRGSGKYHGYPSKLTNDFENEILKRWNAQ